MKSSPLSSIWSAIVLFALALAWTSHSWAADNDRFARIVLFTATDASPPENYEARLASLALRTEAFFASGFDQWKRSVERSEIFARDANGKIEVTLVKGDLLQPKGRAALPEVRKKSVNGATTQRGLRPNGPPVIWWIFYDYPEVKGFQGGARGTGGIAINAYPKGDDLIDINTDLAEGVLNDMAIKGTIHEFGHALGLPHIGPRPALDLGNSLMGPINKSFWQKAQTDDARVYLNEASAAALWKHPVFRNEQSPNPKMPGDIKVENFDVTESPDHEKVIIRGILKTADTAHSVIVLDSERGQYGDYWCRSYLAPIDASTGKFEVTVSEPYAKGALFLSFGFDNGISTSDGKTIFQQSSSVSVNYEIKNGARSFEKTE